MASMLHLVGCYIAHRRRLGYQLNDASRLLAAFARFCARAAPGRPLTTDLALRWANERLGLKPKTRASRLSIVRGFARYCAALDPRTEVPATRLLSSNWQRGTPHIFTPREVRLILQRARRLQTHCSPLHAQTYATLIGLIACTGIRPGEAIRLRLSDFDAHGGTLHIGRCKFSPERTIALHPSCVRALRNYRQARLRTFPFGDSFFVATRGRPLVPRRVEKVFRKLSADIVSRGDCPVVRLYDFRHTFATRLIARWSQQSRPPAHHLILLSRYLGHRGFNSTWWYVSSDSRSLRSAALRFGNFHQS
ncbi:MAG: tyrosine-type recombinase/integrase [Terrimicrobiaceae bacterium]